MKKILKNPLFTFILGLIVATSGVLAVSSIIEDSSEITFDNTGTTLTSTNVEAAIGELSDKLDSSNNNVCAGIRRVELGTASSYNIKSLYPGLYDKLTINNFYYTMGGSSTNIPFNCDGDCVDRSSGTYTQPSVTYDQTTGILTCGDGSLTGTAMWGGVATPRGSRTVSLTTTCYMSVSNIVQLGTNTSYDIRSLYPDKYDKLTSSDFYSTAAGNSVTATRNCDGECIDRGNTILSLSQPSYNPSTGILSCPNGTISVYNLWGGMSDQRGVGSKTVTTTCYIIL